MVAAVTKCDDSIIVLPRHKKVLPAELTLTGRPFCDIRSSDENYYELFYH